MSLQYYNNLHSFSTYQMHFLTAEIGHIYIYNTKLLEDFRETVYILKFKQRQENRKSVSFDDAFIKSSKRHFWRAG